MKAVRPYSLKGKLLCNTLLILLSPLALIKGRKWSKPRAFEENPRTMSMKDILYFAYKYYYTSPLLPEDNSFREIKDKETLPAHDFETKLTLSVGGDLMPYKIINRNSARHLWDHIGPDFFGSDIVFANLETPLDTSRSAGYVPEVMLNDMHFNIDRTGFEIFSGNGQYKGFDVLSTANNHSMDMGAQGLINMLNFLEEEGIKSVGCATSEVRRKTPVIIEKNGIKVGFIAYTYSLNQFTVPEDAPYLVNLLPLNVPGCDISSIEADTLACRNAGADIVVCSVHCGNAYQAYPSATTIHLFQRLFETCGVDIIAGGHPHNLQPWHYYDFKDPYSGKQKKGFAIYSLADFVAYDIYTWCHLCAYLKINIGRNNSGEIVFTVDVNPLVMDYSNGELQLQYAGKVLNEKNLSGEQQDLKLLYDICMNP